MTECPCGSAVDYAGCCGRYHLGAEPPTAATLMRARYSAFALGLEDFLMATSHSTTRPGTPHLDPSLTWTRLQVTGQSGGGMLQGSGTVSFTADYTSGGVPGRLRETSRFEREGGHWRYLGPA